MSVTLTPISEQIGELPVWMQVLVASRAVRRVVSTCKDGIDKRIMTKALDAVDSCAAYGFCEWQEERAMQAATARRGRGEPETTAVREAVFWAVDACMAAEASRDFPSDSAVTDGALNAISAICGDPRYSATRIEELAAADLDVLRSAVRESRLMAYAPVPESLLSRLPEAAGSLS